MFLNRSADIPLLEMSMLFLALLLMGLVATLPMYNFSLPRLIHSRLFIKILMWLPIFAIFTISLYFKTPVKLALVVLIISGFILESKNYLFKNPARPLVLGYILAISLALLHLPLFEAAGVVGASGLLITVCFASVLGDVTAFFMGNYASKHPLPPALNKNKSWEGVLGEVIGAGLGVSLVYLFVGNFGPWSIFVPVGIGSAVGDLINSYVKRSIGIKDWSDNIPGHGGYLDRFSSLSFAIAFAFFWVF